MMFPSNVEIEIVLDGLEKTALSAQANLMGSSNSVFQNYLIRFIYKSLIQTTSGTDVADICLGGGKAAHGLCLCCTDIDMSCVCAAQI